jgi:Flp pilus assembly protein TadG
VRSAEHPSAKSRSLARRRHRRGATAVEFALVLPLMMTLLLGTVDFGRFAYTHIAVTNAARAGAALGSMNPYSSATQSNWQAQVIQATRDEMFQQTGYVAGNLAVTVTPVAEAGGLWRVRVQATYPFQTLIRWPGLPGGSGTPISLQRTVVLRAIR